MLRGIIREVISAEPDLKIVGDFEDGTAGPERIEATEASVVIVALEAPLVRGLMSDRPRVLGVSADGRQSVLYELRPSQRVLGEISPSTLVAAIRGRLSGD
jgi:DNA-binding NarL/FixJ family response regulator